MNKKLETAIRAARAGGETALRYFRTNLTIEQKGDESPVTIADREAERTIVSVIKHAFPEHGILGEEFGEQQGDGARWIIDPIDGTKSFIRGIPFFAALVALEEDGEITTGAVYAPALDDMIYAQKGEGAWDRSGRLHVSSEANLAHAMLVFGGAKIARQSGMWQAYERLVDRSSRQRAYGDYYGFTFVARGQAEAMIDFDLKPWDLGPLKIITEEAGGRFTDVLGTPTIYSGSAVATNGAVHDQILAAFAAAN